MKKQNNNYISCLFALPRVWLRRGYADKFTYQVKGHPGFGLVEFVRLCCLFCVVVVVVGPVVVGLVVVDVWVLDVVRKEADGCDCLQVF